MTAKEKAEELFYKFNGFNTYGLDKMCCKKSAEYLCDEILNQFPEQVIELSLENILDLIPHRNYAFWQQVKEEVNKI